MEDSEDFEVDFELLKSISNKKEILEICHLPIKTDWETTRLNLIVLQETELILKKKGQLFTVHSGKKDRRSMKMGGCYVNSSKMMSKGYGYVEGYVISKDNGYKLGHSWNVDSNGTHWDFTYDNPEKYEYFGIIIPDDVVWEVGRKNGGLWFCVLPFIDDFTLIQ